jgi:hypothetical protein
VASITRSATRTRIPRGTDGTRRLVIGCRIGDRFDHQRRLRRDPLRAAS